MHTQLYSAHVRSCVGAHVRAPLPWGSCVGAMCGIMCMIAFALQARPLVVGLLVGVWCDVSCVCECGVWAVNVFLLVLYVYCFELSS